jgi:hypothetical protein
LPWKQNLGQKNLYLRASKLDLLSGNYSDHVLNQALTLGSELILHLAWISNIKENYLVAEENKVWEEATKSLIKGAEELGIGFAGVGTWFEYSPQLQEIPYVKSKISVKETLLKSTIQRKFWFCPSFIVSFEKKRPRLIRDLFESGGNMKINNPNQCEDFIMDYDVASAMHTALELSEGGVFDLGSGQLLPVRELVKIAQSVFGIQAPQTSSGPFKYGKRADISNLLRLGWTPSATEKYLSAK